MREKYIKFTDSELERANAIDLVSFLQSKGEHLKHIGRDYKLIYTDASGTHDSITIRGNKWYDHKNQEGGGTIKFLQWHYNLNFREAVQELIGIASQSNSPESSAGSESPAPRPKYQAYIPPPSEPPKEFILPSANQNMRRVFAYLTKERHLDAEVLTHFAHEHKIYEENNYHNVVFVGYDENGTAKQAHKRSTLSFGNSTVATSAFRQTIEGSDTRYGFNHIGTSNRVYVFEAPIDMLSFISLYKQNWKEHSYITLNGVYEHALTHILEVNPNINEIYLCTDNDVGGIDAADRLSDIFRERNYRNIFRIAPEYKDWNECLKAQFGIVAQTAVPHKRKELYFSAVNNINFVEPKMNKISSILWALFKQGQYQNLVETSLSACAVFSKRINPERDYFDCFSDIKKCLLRDYRAYKDRGKITTKVDDLNKSMQNVMKDLKENNVRTTVQLSETARLLYFTANCALRCAVETELVREPKMLPQAREPTIAL